jgi:hypothetical protein
MMIQTPAKIPKEVAQLLSGGLVRSIEFLGDSVLVTISTKEFFARVLEGSGIEFIEANSERIVLRVPLSFLNE